MKASTYSFDAIGTTWSLEIEDIIGSEKKDELLLKIKDRIELFDKAYSRFREDGLIAQISRSSGTYVFPMDADTLFSYYKKFYDITDGKVTPLIGDVLSDAGYNLEYTLVQSKTLDRPLPWDEVLEYRYPKLVVKKKTTLDFGAGGKGYLIDIISSLMEKEGIEEYCIDAGGDMLVRNSTITPLQVGLEDPEDINKVIGTVSLVNQSIAGSAGNRRVWGEFHHIIDPETLTSPRHTLGLWVIAQNTILADLLATALFFTEPSILAEHFQFEFLVVHADRSITKSQGFVVDLFS
jgi:thiamine biosynthesis lipoprotein